MTPAVILNAATGFALLVLSLGLMMTVVRIVRGPTLPDRVLGLDMLVAIAIGFIAAIAIRTGFDLYIDIAIALGLVGFLATVAFARFILVRGLSAETGSVQGTGRAAARAALVKGGKARPRPRGAKRGRR